MTTLLGNEIILVEGVTSTGLPSGREFKTTTQNIANLSGFSSSNSSVINYLSWAGISSVSSSDVTASLQNFLLYCNLLALKLKTSVLDDQAQRVFVTAYLPRGDYYITSPIIVPELVNLKCDGLILRRQSGLNVLSNYTGNTSALALGNAYMPAVCVVPKGHCETINLLCNPDGSAIQGAGMFVGKNWYVATFALGSPGSGYSVNDVIACAQPSLSPYISATCTVTSVDGSGRITGINTTPTNSGAYALPPVLQAQQWTTTNGFTVFDSNGNFLTTGGTGTGATLTPVWNADWVNGNATYNMGAAGLIADTLLGENIRIMHVGVTTDSNFGPMKAFWFYGLNIDIGGIEAQGGANGIDFTSGTDIRAKTLNSIGAKNPIIINNSQSINCQQCILDTPSGVVFIDQGIGIDLKGRIFNRNVENYPGAPSATPITIQVGANSSAMNYAVKLDFQMDQAGAGNSTAANAGNAAIYVANCDNSSFNFNINNNINNFTLATLPVITSAVSFGSNVGANNNFSGTFQTNTSFPAKPLTSGTFPNCGFNILNGISNNYAGTSTPKGQITGLILSNDVTSPNTVLDVSVGQAADSTGFYMMNLLTAFTKATGGTWVAGNGANGMGTGLTIANSTWYHVFLILNNGVDIYFDTSVTAANAPANTVAFRRIGSFKTNSSAQILGFFQDEETFYWSASVQDVAVSNLGTSATLYTVSTPLGVKTRPLIRFSFNNDAIISSPDGPDEAPSANLATPPGFDSNNGLTGGIMAYPHFIYTNTSSQIRMRAATTNATGVIQTRGWMDSRGRF